MSRFVRLPVIENALVWAVALFVWTFPVFKLYLFISNNWTLLSRYCIESRWFGVDRVTDFFDLDIQVMLFQGLEYRVLAAAVQLLGFEVIRQLRLSSVWLTSLHVSVSLLYLCTVLGCRLYATQLSIALLVYGLCHKISKHLAISVVVVTFFLQKSLVMAIYQPALGEHTQQMVLTLSLNHVILSWRLCHMIIYCYDVTINQKDTDVKSLITYLAYIFHCPTLLGPIVFFRDYMQCTSSKKINLPALSIRVKALSFNLLKFFVLFLIRESMSHVIPIRSMALVLPSSGLFLGHWELLGVSIWSGIHFNLTYMIVYGLGCQLAQFEGVQTPLEPRFVLWITNFSDMWKYFDNGMYRFMRYYIHRPVIEFASEMNSVVKLNQIFASITVFGYVYFWHGYSSNIFYWTLINFTMFTLEQWSKRLVKFPAIANVISRHIGKNSVNYRRLQALTTSPLYICSIMGQIGFLTNSEWLGWHAMVTCWTTGLPVWAISIVLVYFACQAVIDVKYFRKLDMVDSKNFAGQKPLENTDGRLLNNKGFKVKKKSE